MVCDPFKLLEALVFLRVVGRGNLYGKMIASDQGKTKLHKSSPSQGTIFLTWKPGDEQ